MRLVAWSRMGGLALGLLLAAPAAAETPALLSVHAGAFDFLKERKAGLVDVEYRGRPLLWWFRPVAGGMFDTDNAAYGYGGLAIEIWFGTQIVLTPSAVAGVYGNGDRNAKKLGSSTEFRTGSELAWRFQNDTRVGIGFHHISRARSG
ncbi:MAG: acyloxyacyl hydrolase [Proteobacteria bacterium]|nr:acyloxyacyl hydrolase [Pseudomonadota bacterium]